LRRNEEKKEPISSGEMKQPSASKVFDGKRVGPEGREKNRSGEVNPKEVVALAG
jgi:hypothetical protein